MGGREYYFESVIKNLYLNDKTINSIVQDIQHRQLTQLLVLKLPTNYCLKDFEELGGCYILLIKYPKMNILLMEFGKRPFYELFFIATNQKQHISRKSGISKYVLIQRKWTEIG